MVSAWMPVTWEDERVGVIIVFVSTSVFVCVFDELQPFFSLFFYCTCSTSSWDLAKLKNLTLLFGGGYPTLTGRERIKKLAVCCSIQGLFIMYLLPLFKSLMQEVRSHMTEREREGERERERERENRSERGSICVCCVEEWRSLCCYVQTKVTMETTHTISRLIKTLGWGASITPRSHARTRVCAHTCS